MQPFLTDKGWLQRQVEQHGSITAAARAHDVPITTFREAYNRLVGRRGSNQNAFRAKAARPTPGTEVTQEELLRAEVLELRQQTKAFRSGEVAFQKLTNLLEEKIGEKVPRFKAAPKQRSKAFTTHRFVLQYSDTHAAEVVNPEEINGINAYNWDIMLRRHQKLQDSVLSFRENRPYHVDKLHILGLGDAVTGDIHDELRVTNELTLSETCIQLGLDMAEWVEGFIPFFETIQIDAVVGNHGRRSKKPQMKQAFDNFDWIAYQVLKQRLARYPSVSVNVPKSTMAPVMIFDERWLLWHGDGVSSSMVGVPWGGIIRRAKELAQQYAAIGIPFDRMAFGHWHEANVIQQGRLLGNGSMKGPDEYGLQRHGGGAPAMQLLHTAHPRRGITDTSYINLQEIV